MRGSAESVRIAATHRLDPCPQARVSSVGAGTGPGSSRSRFSLRCGARHRRVAGSDKWRHAQPDLGGEHRRVHRLARRTAPRALATVLFDRRWSRLRHGGCDHHVRSWPLRGASCRFSRPAGVIGTIVITLLPPVLGWVIYLGRDVWFTTFLLVACAALVRTVDDAGRVRPVVCIGLVVAVWAGAGRRQKRVAGVCGPHLRHVLDDLGPQTPSAWQARTVSRLLWSGLLALLVLVAVGGSQVLMRRAFDVRATHIEQAVYIYDIAAISIEEGEVLFNPQAFRHRTSPCLTPSSTHPRSNRWSSAPARSSRTQCPAAPSTSCATTGRCGCCPIR